MKTIITKDNFWLCHFLVEAIYKGHHIRCSSGGIGLEILDECAEEEAAGIRNGLGSFSGLPSYYPNCDDINELVKIVLGRINKDPNSRIIEVNEFDMRYYPDYH